MAAGAAPAPEKKMETKTETAETSQPTTLRQRIERKFAEIFQGREEYLGWRQ